MEARGFKPPENAVNLRGLQPWGFEIWPFPQTVRFTRRRKEKAARSTKRTRGLNRVSFSRFRFYCTVTGVVYGCDTVVLPLIELAVSVKE